MISHFYERERFLRASSSKSMRFAPLLRSCCRKATKGLKSANEDGIVRRISSKTRHAVCFSFLLNSSFARSNCHPASPVAARLLRREMTRSEPSSIATKVSLMNCPESISPEESFRAVCLSSSFKIESMKLPPASRVFMEKHKRTPINFSSVLSLFILCFLNVNAGPSVKVHFSTPFAERSGQLVFGQQKDDCKPTVKNLITKTKDKKYKDIQKRNTCKIDVLMYEFNSKEIAQELLSAAQDGVSIRVMINGSPRKLTTGANKEAIDLLVQSPNIKIYAANIQVHGGQHYPDQLHEKLTIATCINTTNSKKEGFALLGSYNFTNAASLKNFENNILLSTDDTSSQDEITLAVNGLRGRFDEVERLLSRKVSERYKKDVYYLELVHPISAATPPSHQAAGLQVVGTPKPLSPVRY